MRRLAAAGLAAAVVLAIPRAGKAMTADGVVITNSALVTAYWRSSGMAYTQRYTMSYNATVTAIVTNPFTTVRKTVTPTIQAAGGTLTYTIWFVNTSPSSSSFSIVATDPMPENVNYSAYLGNWGGGSGGTFSMYNGSDGVTWSIGQPASGQAPPYHLRWVLDLLGPARSAFVSYSVTIQ